VIAQPRSREAARYYRVAKQRFEDATFLLGVNRTTAAVYLAGYSVECMLKALVLSAAPSSQESEVLRSFRGTRAHNYDWLRDEYRNRRGQLPRHVARHLTHVNTWSTDMRYEPGTMKPAAAKSFLDSATEIIRWADRSMGQ